ncbi:MAG: hypothetical protein FJ288_15735 [Planctomycetes bacterium]|nr:hypothetical protein [Planctomycetota bacterium]
MRPVLAACVLAAAMVGCVGPAMTDSPRTAVRDDRFAPVVRGTDDLVPPVPAAAAPLPHGRGSDTPAAPVPPVRVDEKARSVRIPARFTGARGVVERLLSAEGKHRGLSVLVTECSVRDVAAALEKMGLLPGVRPEAVGEDRARPPVGRRSSSDEVFFITVVVRDAEGKEARTPAARFLSRRADGPPLTADDGWWVYVGPQVLSEGGAEILVTEFSGSVVTTNLRDSSAVIYWSPPPGGEAAPYVSAFYASAAPTEAGRPCEVEICVMDIGVP